MTSRFATSRRPTFRDLREASLAGVHANLVPGIILWTIGMVVALTYYFAEKGPAQRSRDRPTLLDPGVARHQCGNLNPLPHLLIGLLLVQPAYAIERPDERAKVKAFLDLEFAKVDGKKLLLDLYIPEGAGKPPLVVWIHGGSWRAGSRKRIPLKDVIRQGYAVASISYRFTDKAIFPAQIHDCKAGIRWLRAHAFHYGYDADWIAVAGSSAGGHLALLVGVSGDVKELEGRVGGHLDRSSSVQAILAYYGLSDFVLRGKSHPERHYAETSGSFALLGGKRDGKVNPDLEALASPAKYVSADDPPLLAFHGKKDKVVLVDQSERIVELYQKAEVPANLIVLESAGHGGKEFFTGKHLETAIDFLDRHRPSEYGNTDEPPPVFPAPSLRRSR